MILAISNTINDWAALAAAGPWDGTYGAAAVIGQVRAHLAERAGPEKAGTSMLTFDVDAPPAWWSGQMARVPWLKFRGRAESVALYRLFAQAHGVLRRARAPFTDPAAAARILAARGQG